MIYILIAAHNRINDTLECLSCIKRQSDKDYKIIIIDDGSTDQTTQIIQNQYPEITILNGDGNLWWGGAMHLGVEYILKQAKESDYILSLNNDVIFSENYLNILKKTSKKYKDALIGSLCLDIADKKTILDSGIHLQWFKYAYQQIPYNNKLSEIRDIDTLSGRGLLIPVSVFKKIGNFAKDNFPHYSADYEFGLRAKKNGFALVLSNQAVVYLKNELTGYRPTAKILSYSDFWKKLFSIKSPNNMLIHLKLIKMYSPTVGLKIFNSIYYFLTQIFLLIKNTISYTLVKIKFIKNG